MGQGFFDPQWLRAGVLNLSNDRRPTRTEQVKLVLNELEGRPFQLIKLKSHGRTSAYYLREGDLGEVEAQYYMSLDPMLHPLALGLSIEKGEESPGANPDRRMDRLSWDWPKLARMRTVELRNRVAAVSSDLGRPLAVIIDTHTEGSGDEHDTVPFVFIGETVLKRTALVSIDALVALLRKIDRQKSLWADVWIMAELTELEVATLSPEERPPYALCSGARFPRREAGSPDR